MIAPIVLGRVATIALLVLGYLVTVVLAYGFILGRFTKVFPDENHIIPTVLLSLYGPAALAIILLQLIVNARGTSFRLKPLTREERYIEFDKLYGPYLTREDFDKRKQLF